MIPDSTGSDDHDVVDEYAYACRIVTEERADGERYHYEGPFGRYASFADLSDARLYADVQAVAGGFREEGTGERGLPPRVASAREDLRMAYLVATHSQGVEYVAGLYGLDEWTVRDYVDGVRARAERVREEQRADG